MQNKSFLPWRFFSLPILKHYVWAKAFWAAFLCYSKGAMISICQRSMNNFTAHQWSAWSARHVSPVRSPSLEDGLGLSLRSPIWAPKMVSSSPFVLNHFHEKIEPFFVKFQFGACTGAVQSRAGRFATQISCQSTYVEWTHVSFSRQNLE